MSHTEALRTRFTAAMMPNYGVPAVALSHGDGTTVYDVDGKPYLDFIGGIATSVLGHGHPALTGAVAAQVGRIAHTSNLFLHEPEVALAEKLLALLGLPGKVFLANSGTEANECALKLAMRYGAANGRTRFVAAVDGFHGRSLGALSLTGKEAIREPFAPFGNRVDFVPHGDVEALANAVDADTTAVFLEPIQGEAGVVPGGGGYLAAARRICDDNGALLVLDEIQSGVGRTGAWFAHQHEGVTPDVVTLAKGLGGGLPIGACIGVGGHGDLFGKGDHGSTFGGNPVAAAAALAVLDTVEAEGLLADVVKRGDQIVAGVTAMAHPGVATVRGRGLWWGIVLRDDRAADLDAALRDLGVLANPVRPDVLRIAPPLTVSAEDVDRFLTALGSALDVVYPPGGRP
ncbi:acetylornithine aminotransferase apoenzyme [Stackebrandtia albiflava]|uniref:Acetylornithine aminotransferase n=1 Tax=Stackebrandtia albiflava TaxID=406432 RepID=A0A562VEJ3_9ACTN|nr:acetylornithine transaminase [Stackebrandtia albiflava]TWJ16278.1 acetylornithine aminotransferase apoenzyme [Stackebrandtia albiflava]